MRENRHVQATRDDDRAARCSNSIRNGRVTAFARANYVHGFDNNASVLSGADGPQNLLNQGWIFRNQSAPVGSGTWHTGYHDYFPPQAGAGYLAVESSSTDYFGGGVSQWAILPAIPNQQAGDVLTFYVRRFSSSNADTLRVRIHPAAVPAPARARPPSATSRRCWPT